MEFVLDANAIKENEINLLTNGRTTKAKSSSFEFVFGTGFTAESQEHKKV